MTSRSTLAGRLVLLTVATLVAVAPLCSTVVAAPEETGEIATHGDHRMASASHEAPAEMFTNVTLRGGHHGEHCAPYSCCAAALVKTARLKQTDGTAVLTLMAETPAASRGFHALSIGTELEMPLEAAAASAPLRL